MANSSNREVGEPGSPGAAFVEEIGVPQQANGFDWYQSSRDHRHCGTDFAYVDHTATKLAARERTRAAEIGFR